MSHCRDDLWENIRIAKPCTANWDAMSGDEQVRACGACKKNVYNISMMRKPEAEQVIREKEGNLCLRLYRRRDGKILTADCPKALRAVRLKMTVVGGFIVATVGGWLGLKWAGQYLSENMMGGAMASPHAAQDMPDHFTGMATKY
jgi:hypothetical protein